MIALATSDGFKACRRSGDGWELSHEALSEEHATCVSARGKLILVGTHDGIHRSEDAGRTWEKPAEGPDITHMRWLLCHPDIDGLAVAGTEPANIYRTEDGGRTWNGSPEVVKLREKGGWYLPYSPEAGCVRGFAAHGSRVYAAVEQGGMLRSDDKGTSWRLVEGSSGDTESEPPPMIHPDVHSVTVHPDSADLVFAPTGGGFYRSSDGGATWEMLYRCYVRAVWVDPADPDYMVLGPADGVQSNGRIEVTVDGGRTWQRGSDGLDTPWPGNMVDRFARVNDRLLAILADGTVLEADPHELNWQRILTRESSVEAITWMPE